MRPVVDRGEPTLLPNVRTPVSSRRKVRGAAYGEPYTLPLGTDLRYDRFVEEYLVDFNETAAYKRAGYTGKPMLLRNPEVIARLRERAREVLGPRRITVERVLEELGQIAFSSLGKYLEWDGKGLRVRASSELTADDLAAVQEVFQHSAGRDTFVRVKLHDKVSALGKLLDFFQRAQDTALLSAQDIPALVKTLARLSDLELKNLRQQLAAPSTAEELQ